MNDSLFIYDVFLSHSVKDKASVRQLAERLRADGLRVWYDEWEIVLRKNSQEKIEKGLEQSRALVLCVSENAFGSEWVLLESQTLRFRDPLNTQRRFIPLRFDETLVTGPLASFDQINWSLENQEQSYAKLLEACRPPAKVTRVEDETRRKYPDTTFKLRDTGGGVRVYAFSADGKFALSGADDHSARLWDLATERSLQVLKGHTGRVVSVEFSTDQRFALSGSEDGTVRLWDLSTGRLLRTMAGHAKSVWGLAWSADQRRALSGSDDKTMRLWNLETGKCLSIFEGHTDDVIGVAWSPDEGRALSASYDKTVRVWEVSTGRCLHVLEGHTSNVWSVAWSPDSHLALSGSKDKSVRVWEVDTGRCLRILKGHTESVVSVAWNIDQQLALSAGDTTVRLWDSETSECVAVLEGHVSPVKLVVWSSDRRRAFSGDMGGVIHSWDLSEFVGKRRGRKVQKSAPPSLPEQIQYTNAKVLLVGDTSAGKTGLSMRLALDKWEPSDSTVGAWATHWKLPISANEGVEREIWLWDFGGQADQRLIHQLYMDETALAVLVFDGQKEDLFETLGQWDRDLIRASRQSFSKLLVAGRVDAGGLRISRSQIEVFRKERGYLGYIETSAKRGIGCEELRQAILDGILWNNIPWRSSPLLFKRLKEEIIRLKDAGRVLTRFNELRETLQLRLSDEGSRFTDEELKAVVSLLTSPGVVWELKFGSWILLQPERINAYAQAVIQTMRQDEYERGCLLEERVLNGDLTYHSSMERLEADEERFVLLAMHQTLVERGLCLREHTDTGALLVFPSYYRRERPELVGHPAVLVSYRFNGLLDDIYATLIVRLHHTKPFQQDQLWRYAADFNTLTGKQLGVKLTRRADGAAELEVYFDPEIPLEEKIIFSRYIHEHLLQNGRDVVRLRHYVCPHCGTPVGNREVAMRKLQDGKKDVPCVNCDDPGKRVPLWDRLEELFASSDIRERVHELEEQSAVVLDSESKERALVGDVISTVALAGQVCREFSVSDHGIDMEIEFKTDSGKVTGRKVYLQLKSGDSYLRRRKSDGAEIFRIDKARHADYWREQAFPVLLVIRSSGGEIRWMEIRDYLRRQSERSKTPATHIIFEGQRFDVMSVRRWRDEALRSGSAVG